MNLVCRDNNKLVIRIQHSKEWKSDNDTLVKESNKTKRMIPSNRTDEDLIFKHPTNKSQQSPYFMYLVKVQESANTSGVRIIFLVSIVWVSGVRLKIPLKLFRASAF